MPIRRCPDCGQTVSTSASRCPHCGRGFTRWYVWAVLLVVVVIVVLGVMHG